MRNTLRHLWHLPRNAIVLLVRGYQHTLSPDHGPMRHAFDYGYCRHTPTCSQYAIEQLERRGAVVGCVLAAWRVLSCNPWRKPDDATIISRFHR